MTIDWSVIWTHIGNAAVWILTHPAETAGTITLIAGWAGFSKKLKEDAAAARAKLRIDRLKMVGELAYGQAAFNERKATGVKTNKLAAALEAADQFLMLLSEDTSTPEERQILAGIFTAKHENETALVSVTNPAAPASGC